MPEPIKAALARTARALAVLGLLVCLAPAAAGQSAYAGNSLPGLNSGYSSGVGVGFGFNLGGSTLMRGDDAGPSQTIGLLPGGGFTPDGAIRFRQGGAGGAGGFGFGFAQHGGGGSGFFRLSGSQGTARGLSSMSTSVTALDGHTGYFGAGVLQPFVTGVIPIVGDQPSVEAILPPGAGIYAPHPGQSALEDRLARLVADGQTIGGLDPSERRPPGAPREEAPPPADRSTAAAPVESLGEIRRQQQASASAAQNKTAERMALADAAANDGRYAEALNHLRVAARDAAADDRGAIEARMAEIEARRRARR